METRKHFKELDGVRGIAALMVMFFHFFQELVTDNQTLLTVKKLAFFGQTGVSLFFVLSGFLITRILIKSKEADGYFLNFYARRVLRIFPLYFLFLALFYFVLTAIEGASPPPFGEQVWYWTYLQNVAMTFNWSNNGPSHFWSLAVEEHFYLFWPFVVYFLDKKQLKKAIFIIIGIAVITRIILLKNHYGIFSFTLTRMDELAIGALLAVHELEGKLKQASAKKYLLAFLLAIIPTVGLWVFTSGLKMDWIQVVKFSLLAFCYFSLIGYVLTVSAAHWLKRLLCVKPLSYTGKISYGLYVYHPACFYLTAKYLMPDSLVISFILSFSVCYLVASISFYAFENQFLKLKPRFQSKTKSVQ